MPSKTTPRYYQNLRNTAPAFETRPGGGRAKIVGKKSPVKKRK